MFISRIRAVARTLLLLWIVALAIGDFFWRRLLRRGGSPRQRAEWLHHWCRKGLPYLGIHFTTRGGPPQNGLLVANHLSYLDIMILSAITPCVFVAKREIERWPIFGFMSRMAGTIFLDRARRAETRSAQGEMERRLSEGLTVVLFPEATSSDGTSVLPFRSALFQAVINAGAAISAARISYQVSSGRPETDVCFWGEMKMVPHVMKLLSKGRVTSHVRFAEGTHRFADRKQAARTMYEQVLQLVEEEKLVKTV
ncbi:MAG: 1-acyl-sn-glycerol-3-phosphate acyltransferase [Acidobacteriales bacterium]|nr:1-acyl-sn-glycerol-3-phosphate acyltransferase [Terriglobales bacterium]